jgi:hypothetical protein
VRLSKTSNLSKRLESLKVETMKKPEKPSRKNKIFPNLKVEPLRIFGKA